MSKIKTVFVCQNCGAQRLRWEGRCAECGEWNTLVEERATAPAKELRPSLAAGGPQPVSEIATVGQARIATGIDELDRILGGGAVLGSAVLIGGDPGIGKSTLLLQAGAGVARAGLRTLYVTAEESLLQIKLRAQRLGINTDHLLILAENNLEVILEQIRGAQPDLVVIDTIQMVYHPQLASAPGSVSQVRESATALTLEAKSSGVPIFLIGHVTKEGALAGPRVLEHIVDAVLYFEGDRDHTYRILRGVKNRFGATNEIGVFEMRGEGLRPVANPSALFLSSRRADASGSVVVPCMEGTRPLLVEIQALASRTNFPTPERKVTGLDRARVVMILAVLERRAGIQVSNQDVFVNVVGGVRVPEPAADLGIALAVASSVTDGRLPAEAAVIGEIGLAGEVRGVPQMNPRILEAKKLGFKQALVPLDNLRSVGGIGDFEFLPVSHLGEALLQMKPAPRA